MKRSSLQKKENIHQKSFMRSTQGCLTCTDFQNALAYFDAAVSYTCKMFMTLTPGRRSAPRTWP